MPFGLSITTKANLLAGKYTFSYSPLVLWWPPLSHFKGKREFFLASPWFQHIFKISYNIPNNGKKALHQGSRQVLLCHKRHLQLPLHSLASLGQPWLGRDNPIPQQRKKEFVDASSLLPGEGQKSFCAAMFPQARCQRSPA